MAAAIRVLVADDSPAFRDGMRDLLALFEDVELVALASDAVEAVALARSLQPDVAVMDFEMPGGGGVVATREISAASPNIGVLLLSMHDDDSSVLDAMQAGARGYLVKGARQQALLGAIRTVADGGAVFGAGIAARLIDYFAAAAAATTTAATPILNRERSAKGPFAQLSARERQVLELIAQGRSNEQIADELSLSHGTVRNYTSAIFSKLQVSNRAAAIVKAHRAETS